MRLHVAKNVLDTGYYQICCMSQVYLELWYIPSALSTLQHGESVCNLYGKIGGDSPLSHRGEEVSHLYNVHGYMCPSIMMYMYMYIVCCTQFAKALKDFMEEQGMHGFKVRGTCSYNYM